MTTHYNSNKINKDHKLEIARQDIYNCLHTTTNSKTFAIADIKILKSASPIHIIQPSSNTTNNGNNTEDVCTYNEGERYRCKCTFQLVPRSQCSSLPSTINNMPDDLVYVTREHGEVVPLPNGIFPPANIRIRHAMSNFITNINRRSNNKIIDLEYNRIRRNLTSVTFITSWRDGVGICSSDCLVILHYGPPGLSNKGNAQDTKWLLDWKSEANSLCKTCMFTMLTGRSKGVVISVKHEGNVDEREGIIHDELYLTLSENENGDDNDDDDDQKKKIIKVDQVSLLPPNMLTEQQYVCIQIQYEKPSTAFQHPNASVMLTSLQWILNIMSSISNNLINHIKPRLLEMYCGCGAHTVPLAKSTILSEIVAVELDERLVKACRNNCKLNNCLKDDESNVNNDKDDDQTFVQVFKGDATEWADKTLRRQNKQQDDKKTDQQRNTDYRYNNFDILLVDPPRDGLSSTVCNMALKGTFTHVIYVSCGRRALLRDLTILCGDEGGFDVADLAVIDLFPGTEAVESLVHLKRRQQ